MKAYIVTRTHPKSGYKQFWRNGWNSTPPIGLFADLETAERCAREQGGVVEETNVRACP